MGDYKAYCDNNNRPRGNSKRLRKKLINSTDTETGYLTDIEITQALEKNLFIVPERFSSPYKPKPNKELK